MKEFHTTLSEIEKTKDGYLVCGRCAGTEPIRLGDFLNDLEVVKIEAYSHELTACDPGLSARLTLSYKFWEEHCRDTDYLPLILAEYKSDYSPTKIWP